MIDDQLHAQAMRCIKGELDELRALLSAERGE